MAQQAQKLSLHKPSRSEEIISEAEKEAALKKVCLTSFFNYQYQWHTCNVWCVHTIPAFSDVVHMR